MNHHQSSASELPLGAARRPRAGRFFHTGAAVLLLLLTLWGFEQFYLHGRAYPGRELTPPIRTLLILHGALMAMWMVLILVQPLLIATGERRTHMAVGKIGAIVAAGVVLVGLKLGIEAARVSPPDLLVWGLQPDKFLAIPIVSVLMFGGFVTAGILTRRRPEVHRSMMLLATLAAVPAAVSRIDAISRLYQGTVSERIFGPFLGTLAVACLLLLVKWRLTRSFDRIYALGCAALIVSSALIMRLATTDAWGRIARVLMG